MDEYATEYAPIYRKVLEEPLLATRTYMIVCDEGWRESIVCNHMYEWAADWLLGVLSRQPYAPHHRPGSAPAPTEEGG